MGKRKKDAAEQCNIGARLLRSLGGACADLRLLPGVDEAKKRMLDMAAKRKFCTDALQMPDKFTASAALDSELLESIDWICQHTAKQACHSARAFVFCGLRCPCQVNELRLRTALGIEALGKMYWDNGMAAAWLRQADPSVAQVCPHAGVFAMRSKAAPRCRSARTSMDLCSKPWPKQSTSTTKSACDRCRKE